MNSILLVLLYTIIVIVIVISGGDIRTFIDKFKLPYFYPPNYLFGLVWSILFIIFGIYIYYAPLSLQIIGVIYFTLVLLWTPIFVKSKSLAVGFYYLLFIDIITIAFIISAFYIRDSNLKYLPYILVPQLCWVSFATIIAYSLYSLN